MATLVLPDPDQFSSDSHGKKSWNKDVVIYDGQCRFCLGQVEKLHRWDSKKTLTFISLHDPRISEHCPDLSHDDLMKQMYVVRPEGTRYGGVDAVRYLSRKLPRLFWLAPLLHIPFSLPLWRWLYAQVAKRRYQIAGKMCDGDACSVHFK